MLTPGEETEGHNPMVFRTHSRSARFRRGYPKTPPPKRGGFEFMCEVPQLRNAFTMSFRVDREGKDDAEAILYAIHPGLVRICYLEDDMRIERFHIDPDFNCNVRGLGSGADIQDVFVDDEYIYVMGWSEEEGDSPHGFIVYSRETKELVLTVPSMPHEQTPSNSFLMELECLEDRSRPARWGQIPEEVTFTKAIKNRRSIGFPVCACCTCTSYNREIIIVCDDLVFTQACDLFVWKDYLGTLKRISRSKVTCPTQRGRWFASLCLCIQAPTQEQPYNHWCLRSWAATKHHLVCAFQVSSLRPLF